MCGINGIVSFKNKLSQDESYQILHSMNSCLLHRGPDDSGVWVHEHADVGLGQTRLSILDLSEAGHQPMHDTKTGNVITFNGEIFNFRDLNTEYFKQEKFISGTDTETILKLYRKFGLGMLNMLNGMFSLGLWDEQNQELILARDKSGKKPLYYTEQNGKFLFASELKAILGLPWVKKELDEKALYDFLTYNVVLPPYTMFKNIFKFDAGHYMRVNNKGILDYKPYYTLEKKTFEFENESQVTDAVYEALAKSVKYRMISDVPVGAFLSGGVDSSAVVALMRQNSEKQIKTFTIGFEGQPDYNEIKYAEGVANMFDTDHHVKMVKPDDLMEFLPKVVDIYDEPQADTTSIPIYFISELAKQQNIKVVLNGDGADELFAGYRNNLKYVNNYPYFKAFDQLPTFAKKMMANLISPFDNGNPVFEMMNRLTNGQEYYWPGAQSVKESSKKILLNTSFSEKLINHSSYWYVDYLKDKYKVFKNSANGEVDLIEWMSFSGFYHADMQRFLYRSDRLGMAHSIESRSPFLNIDVVELALSIPSSLKIKNNEPKYILKKSLERILPNDVLYRKKMGFCLPIREWASDTIVEYIENNYASFSSNYNIFNEETIKSQLSSLKAGNQNYTNNVWTIYFLMRWFNKWL
jgi:asparagine synthase (glutamine-hydrolysing)